VFNLVYSDGMTKRLFIKIQNVKGKAAKEELRRAHAIIGILSLSLAFLLVLGALQPLELEPVLALIAAALLGFVAVISLGIAYLLTKK
jgi:hypothetical protein